VFLLYLVFWMVVQFGVSGDYSEPSAVAPDARITLCQKRVTGQDLREVSYLPTTVTKLTPASGATALGSVINISFRIQLRYMALLFIYQTNPLAFLRFSFLLNCFRLEWTAWLDRLEKRIKYLRFLPAAFVIIGAAVFTAAQQSPESKHNARPEGSTVASKPNETEKNSARYSYEFTQPEFYVRHVVIEHDVNGRGRINFERRNEDQALEEPLELSAAANARILKLWETLRFLDSDENYQSDRQYPHLGTMRLTMEQDPRKRTAEFNWTHNKNAALLIDEYRRIADQAILIFDISVARENQPLNGPKLMDQIETMLKRNGLSDPQQLVPLLREITTDEHLPLMARNHAARLLKKIEK